MQVLNVTSTHAHVHFTPARHLNNPAFSFSLPPTNPLHLLSSFSNSLKPKMLNGTERSADDALSLTTQAHLSQPSSDSSTTSTFGSTVAGQASEGKDDNSLVESMASLSITPPKKHVRRVSVQFSSPHNEQRKHNSSSPASTTAAIAERDNEMIHTAHTLLTLESIPSSTPSELTASFGLDLTQAQTISEEKEKEKEKEKEEIEQICTAAVEQEIAATYPQDNSLTPPQLLHNQMFAEYPDNEEEELAQEQVQEEDANMRAIRQRKEDYYYQVAHLLSPEEFMNVFGYPPAPSIPQDLTSVITVFVLLLLFR
eukprot:MONOS_7564.1-p1 / transcript=MONOS_7564.1 / gene=MONOS_7564 / organism=Monocercomonoides_exilis_PA203 / gene_product=unspecified product / transcript_product=unspecified product / location=Mono_scaffold00261:39549-40484(-) / protein_length=312 / sequence_SO=supercontig / SO=protein_coding / is_pseudo=false